MIYLIYDTNAVLSYRRTLLPLTTEEREAIVGGSHRLVYRDDGLMLCVNDCADTVNPILFPIGNGRFNGTVICGMRNKLEQFSGFPDLQTADRLLLKQL